MAESAGCSAADVIDDFKKRGVRVSLFVDAVPAAIELAHDLRR